jgi:hypothetical protein
VLVVDDDAATRALGSLSLRLAGSTTVRSLSAQPTTVATRRTPISNRTPMRTT